MKKLRYLLVFLFGFTCATASAKPLKDYLGHVKSLSAKFEQYVYNESTQTKELSAGNLYVKSPDKFRLEYFKPYKQLYVADGTRLWSYDEDLEQVTVKDQKGLLDNTPAFILSNPAKLESAYDVKQQKTENNVAWFHLSPKNPDSGFDHIRLGFAGKNLYVMELFDSFGQRTLLTFKELSYNPVIAKKQFTFIPPKGVDIIGDVNPER